MRWTWKWHKPGWDRNGRQPGCNSEPPPLPWVLWKSWYARRVRSVSGCQIFHGRRFMSAARYRLVTSATSPSSSAARLA